jgi:hypothetical protein
MLQTILFSAVLLVQQPAQPAVPQAPPSPRQAAQVDITGNWVALITEEWRWRMITPPKGDYPNVPLNPEGRKIADSWDLAKDNAAGNQCKAFGAGGILRLPLRLRVSWSDDNTLKLETDAGQQTRLFNFDKTKQPVPQRTLQGFTAAEWTRPLPQPGGRGGGARGAAAAPAGPPRGALKIVTRNLSPGYLRKNGVPYSENAVVTEYFDRVSGFGTDYLIVTTIVEDPTYLTGPFMVTSQFMREPDGSRFKPSPCRTDPPARTAPPTANGD